MSFLLTVSGCSNHHTSQSKSCSLISCIDFDASYLHQTRLLCVSFGSCRYKALKLDDWITPLPLSIHRFWRLNGERVLCLTMCQPELNSSTKKSCIVYSCISRLCIRVCIFAYLLKNFIFRVCIVYFANCLIVYFRVFNILKNKVQYFKLIHN